ncbi:MAG TPA: hypothetical protein VN947_33765 [Polyangia bacterium]|nr:hypothetical protein [Polyangia bacterium]
MLVAAAARADEPDAKTLFERGKTQFALGHFSEAADLFERAFEKKSDPAMLFNAAQAHRLAGNKKKALILYQNYSRLYGEQANNAEVERRIGELRLAIAADEAAHPAPPPVPSPEPAPPPATQPQPAPAPPAVAAQPTVVAHEAPPHKRRAWIWGVVAGGVVLVGGAVALGIVFGSKHEAPAVTLGTVTAN